MDVPIQSEVHQSNGDPQEMSILCIISWTIGVLVAVGFVVMFAKCIMGRRHPPPPVSGPPNQGPPSEEPPFPEPRYPLYPLCPQPLGVAPLFPPPPQDYEGDPELGTINERADRITKSSKAGSQTRVPPPPYYRRC
ncbi:hypothetical protein F52700_1715 [Fusarium sp. NRRL 52700]|nr:hypothetical protein F52700_1715 [Fusarium sp. NRRL 52700]